MPAKEISTKRLHTIIRKLHPDADTTLVDLAFEFAKNAHDGQVRLSGDPYIVHPLAAAETLASWGMDTTTIQAGLLHDSVEDTGVPLASIKKEFGADVASIVEGVTKLGHLKYRGMERYMENLRKMFIAFARDARVILVKFADRLHNLATLDSVPQEKRRRIALETLEIYAPIANRLGMGEIKGQLEDASFPYVLPDEYKWVRTLVADTEHTKQKNLKHMQKRIEHILSEHDIKIMSIHGRAKRLYSLYKKLLEHDRDITSIYDLIALRIIVPTITDCYAALGLIHQEYKPLKGRIKDYIAQPKPNGYQSLHTTVFCEKGDIVEIQIRTPEMHEQAEYGIVAHWRYKEGLDKETRRQLRWMEELDRWRKELETDQEDALKNLKIDVFQNRIFVFTPKGDVIDLPENATAIDFAYYVHTSIGDQCGSARVNNEMAALNTQLKSGDVVEIIIDRKRKKPNPDWLKFVKTRMAREHIKYALRGEHRNLIKRLIAKKK